MYTSKKLSLKGRVALVTGASKGLGRSIAIGLAEAGASVALLSRTRVDLEKVASEIRAIGEQALVVPADVTRPAQVATVVDEVVTRLGGLDILVHSAGGSLRKPVLDLTDDEWDRVIASNLTSTFVMCRAVGRVMLKREGGSIINISSSAGLRGRPMNAPYSAAKAGVINLSRALAMEWARKVRVNVLAPGRFLTPLTESEMNDEEQYAAFVKQVPLGRIGQPDELKEIAVWLASDASSFMTGSVLTIDGGQTLR